ncbi:hypothetical protein TNCV_1276951 [Trichonephila clavipes]|nr:hypothetical protein TNCV_1276951 [Trichonephila clavipes]
MIVQFRNEKVSNHGSIPITIDCNVVAFIVFEEGFHQPIKSTKQDGRESVKDDERSGRSQTFRTAENIEKFYVVVYEVESALLAELEDLAKNGFQKYFDVLYRRWQKCVVAQGSYFEGGCVSATQLVHKPLLQLVGQSDAEPPVFCSQASSVLIYQPSEGMKGRFNLDQPEI